MKYAERTGSMKPSEIRELLKITENSDIISFGGGMPSPKSFPVDVIQRLCKKVLKEDASRALQYGPTEGIKELRKALVKRMAKRGIRCEESEIIVTTGSQQVLDIVPKIFINPGDCIAVEVPTYLGAISAFNPYQPRYLPIPMDNNGMITEKLESALEKTKAGLIYVIPSFQNPSGVTMSLERRKHLLETAEKFDVPILEDDAYYDIRFAGKNLKPTKSMDKNGIVIYTGTFSKVLSPGFRLGYVVANEDIIRKFSIAKQGADLCTNMFVQFLAYEYMRSGAMDRHIPKIKKMYKRKRDVMLSALEKHFPKNATWTKPEGGMFIWATIPGVNTKEMLPEALKEKVAYVSGSAFHVDGGGHNTMRLNFSNADDDKIEIGIKRLARIIKERLI
jgi:2-aminoadipate transaminase